MRAAPLALLAATACAHTDLPAGGEDASARDRVRKVVLAQYAAVERGDLTAWASSFSAGALLFGTDRNETWVGKDAIAARAERGAAARMAPGIRRTYRSTSRPRIGLSPDEHAAWVSDEIEYLLEKPNGTHSRYLMRMTELLAVEDGRWLVQAAHYSVAVPEAKALSDAWRVPDPVPDSVGQKAAPLAQVVTGWPAASPHLPGLFADRDDVWLYGTAPEEAVAGGQDVQRFVRQGDESGSARVERLGGLSAAVTAAGNAGWVGYCAVLKLKRQGRQVELPVRVLDVFLREGQGWRKVQEHVSLAQPEG